MISSPPPLSTTPKVPIGLSICAGLVGLVVSVGAGLSGFFVVFFNRGVSAFNWSPLLQVTMIVSFVGAILALLQHDAGGPILVAAGTVMAVVVATTVTAEGFELDGLLDDFPVRGLAFLGGGVAGAVAAALGIACLRGRGKPALGVVNALLAIVVLGCHAGLVRLEDRQFAFNVRPWLGIAVILGVMVLGSFVGRAGAVAAAAGGSCLIPLYLELALIDDLPRVQLAAVATVALVAIVAVSLVAAVLANREQPVVAFGQFPPITGQQPVRSPQPFPTPGTSTAPYGTAGFGTPGSGTPAYGTPSYDSGGYESTQQLPTINEATTPMGALFEPQPVATVAAVAGAAGSTGAQWAQDPYGRHQMRYWDGQKWTQYVSDDGVSDMDPVS